jgi:antirestriction protein
MKTTTTATARLYVGTYAKYSAGSIKGAWLDLTDYSSREEFLDAARELHADESDPELMFQDFEGFPSAWYSESSAPEAGLWEWLDMPEAERVPFALYADHMGGEVELDAFRDAYAGTCDSEADFAENLATETDALPKDLPAWICIDWEATWNSNLRFDYFAERDDQGTLHFFRNN